jgi:hypothetical protein
MTKLELLGAVVIVVVTLAVVGLQAWSLLRPSRVPERLTEAELEELFRTSHAEPFSWMRDNLVGAPGSVIPVDGDPRLLTLEELRAGRVLCTPAFDWPPRKVPWTSKVPAEHVRHAVTTMLLGGPDYRGRS